MIRISNLFILLLCCCWVAKAQPHREFPGPGKEHMIEKVQSMRVAFLTNKLDLTTDESTRFWPVYNEYSKKRMELRKENFEIKRELKDKDLSDQQSKDAVENQFAIQEKELALKKNYYEKFKAILPPQKLAKLEPAEMEFHHEVLRKLKEKRKR